MGYNHITLVGDLANDPETKFVLAVSGRKKEDGTIPVDLLNIVCNGNLGELCQEHLEKGRRVLIDGKLQIRETSGRHWVTEVVADNVTFLNVGTRKEGK